MRLAPAADVRALIAAHMLGPAAMERVMGQVTLHEHQARGVERIRHIIATHGGALLADDVGLGKTYMALAVARDAAAPLVLAPAALRDVWSRAFDASSVHARFISFEQLSRGIPAPSTDFAIVDEAHHLRTRGTRRFTQATRACSGSRVLLLSATPVQNRIDDFRTIVSLFLGERAFALPLEELAAVVVRRTTANLDPSNDSRPDVRPPEWLDAVADEDCLDGLLALPAPLPPRDGDDGGALVCYTLARQWASSRAALRGALRRRLASSRAMEDALVAGRLPTRSELQAWCFADGAQQLTFPELTVAGTAGDAAALLAQVREHAAALRDLLRRLDATDDPDDRRAELLRVVLRRHPGERVVCFSEFAATVHALYTRLLGCERCAMLTHAGGRVAGGAISRRDLLERFAPGSGVRATPRDRIDILLTTDVLSEGVSLHDASVVVHLDLAWNPARLEQRVGRLRRIGATRDVVSVYVIAPPAPAERLLQMDRRLRSKIGDAARSVGLAGAILPGLVAHEPSASACEERIAGILHDWRGTTTIAPPAAAAARATVSGAIACVRQRGETRLLAMTGGNVSESRPALLALLECAGAGSASPSTGLVESTCDTLRRWLRRRSASAVVDLTAVRVARTRRALLRRVQCIAQRVPRHERPALAPLMTAARSAATVRLSAGAERVLDLLACAPMEDGAWLRALGEFVALHGQGTPRDEPGILALLLLIP